MKILRWDKCKNCPFVYISTYPVMFVCLPEERNTDPESIPDWCPQEDEPAVPCEEKSDGSESAD